MYSRPMGIYEYVFKIVYGRFWEKLSPNNLIFLLKSTIIWEKRRKDRRK